MPYPNEHSARVADPAQFENDSFRRKEVTDGVTLILGKKTGEDSMTAQAYRFDKEKFSADEAQKWLADHDIKTISFEPATGEPQQKPQEQSKQEPPQTFDLNNVEILSVGDWNGTQYEMKTLQKIADSFQKLSKKIKPFLKLGHDEKQAMLQSDGYPAAGWITNLKIVGDKLIADIKNVPKKIYNLIKEKGYGRFSSEIYKNLKVEGEIYPYVLRAVALLGADTPAVTNLDDFINLYTKKDYEELLIMGEQKMENKVEKVEKVEKDYEKLLKDALNENKTLKLTMQKKEEEKRNQIINDIIEKGITEGKILPTQKHYYAALMSDVEKYTYIEDNQEKIIENDKIKLMQKIVETNPTLINLNAQSQYVSTDKKSDDEIMHEKILRYSKENKVTYAEAFDAIAQGGK